MAIPAFSPEWAQAFKTRSTRARSTRRPARAGSGPWALAVEAEPDKNFPESRGVVMDLYEGRGQGRARRSPADARACDFVIAAPTRAGSRSPEGAGRDQGHAPGQAPKLKGDLRRSCATARPSQELTGVHDRVPVTCRTRVSTLVEYANGEDASAFAQMLAV